MTVELSVRNVRAALDSAAGPGCAGVGEPVTLLLGRLFHETFAALISVEPTRSGLPIIVEGQGNGVRRMEQLLGHAWSKLLAPKLLANAAPLQGASAEVLTTWRATQNLCRWLDAVVVELLEKYPDAQGSWAHLGELFEAEVRIDCLFEADGWNEPVRLVGIADSILRIPGSESYCAIELKLGRGVPVADLGQVLLYHMILSRIGTAKAKTALTLLRFCPELDERLVDGSESLKAEGHLLDLIGRLAGVIPEEPKPVVKRPTVPPAVQGADDLAKRLKRAFHAQGVAIEIRGEPQSGPRFVRFDVRLAPGGRISAIRGCTREVQHRLELNREPMIVEDAGHLYVDLERKDPKTVLFSTVLDQLPQLDVLRGSARVPVGVDSAGDLHFADLASSGRSHILVAGTTGSGKSEWLRMALAGLIAENTPETLRIVTLDPKLAAFGDLEHSKYLWKNDAWWIPGCGTNASELFQDLVGEMDRRYQLVHEYGADNLAEHVEKTGKPLPRIVCVCDEYYALISQQKSEQQSIEADVGLLGAKGRAAGVHLILATQQPSRKTISGAIQANLPCRVALYLQSHIESNMILNQAGAERLTGSGDLLYKDFGNPVRLQAPYLPEAERRKWLRA